MEEESWEDVWGEAASTDRTREQWNVGRVISLPQFDGQCVGDDMTWVGSDTFRVVLIQGAGGSGTQEEAPQGTAAEIGKHWGIQARKLGAHLLVVTETRIKGTERHQALVRGLRAAGATSAFSWNTETSETRDKERLGQEYEGGL